MLSKNLRSPTPQYYLARYYLNRKLKRAMEVLEGFNLTPVSILELQGDEDLKWLELHHPLINLDDPKHWKSCQGVQMELRNYYISMKRRAKADGAAEFLRRSENILKNLKRVINDLYGG